MVKYSRLLRATSSWALNICKNWDSTTFLGSLFQWLISLTVNIFVLVSSQNFLCCNLWQLPLSFHHAPLRRAWHCPTLVSCWQELSTPLPGFCTGTAPCSALPFRGAEPSSHTGVQQLTQHPAVGLGGRPCKPVSGSALRWANYIISHWIFIYGLCFLAVSAILS